MGDNVSLFDSLVITVFSIAVVFIVLIGISILINLLKNLGGDKTQEIKAQPIREKKISKNPVMEIKENKNELVAVIAAAIAASLGTSTDKINIRKIKRLNQGANPWSEAGKREQISNI